jgi:hypothetical protein
MPLDAAGGNPPTLTIVLPLEGPPRIFVDALHEGDDVRLRDWIGHHPELADLLDDALAIRDSWLRAA